MEERKQAIQIALEILRQTLVDTETSLCLYEDRIIFFATGDYLETNDINKIPRFSVKIEELVK